MKKILALIISAIICIGCVTPAFADMEGPYFLEYEAVMTKQDGFSEEDYEGNLLTVPAGATVTVTGEYENENSGLKYAHAKYEDHTFDIPMRYIDNVNDNVNKDKAVRLSKSMSFKVINPEGAPIRKGPAESYETIGTIPVDTVITPEYGTIPNVSMLPWAYIEYDGISGWTQVFQFGYCYDYACPVDKNSEYTGELLIMDDNLMLYDTISHAINRASEKYCVSDKIPAGTTLKFESYYRFPKSTIVFTEYNGVKGWLETDESSNGFGNQTSAIGENHDIMVIDEDGLEIFTEPYNSGESTGVTVPADEMFKTDMRSYRTVYKSNGEFVDFSSFGDNDYPDDDLLEFENTYRVNYKGTKGWITTRGFYGEGVLISWDIDPYYTAGELELKSRFDSDETVAVIPAGKIIKPIFDYYGTDDGRYNYCEYDGKYGWFSSEDPNAAWEVNVVLTLPEDVEIYSEPRSGGELLGTIHAGEEFGNLYSTSYRVDEDTDTYYAVDMVTFNGIKGWIEYDTEIESTYVRELIVEPEETEETEATGTLTETGDAVTGEKSPVKSMVAVYIAVAAAVALAALVTIILIAKKKKSK